MILFFFYKAFKNTLTTSLIKRMTLHFHIFPVQRNSCTLVPGYHEWAGQISLLWLLKTRNGLFVISTQQIILCLKNKTTFSRKKKTKDILTKCFSLLQLVLTVLLGILLSCCQRL